MTFITRVLVVLTILGAGPAAACLTDLDCSDGTVCNGVETCQAGNCIPGTPINCVDTNNCTVDSCDPTNGCTFTPTNDCTVPGRVMKMGTRGTARFTIQTHESLWGKGGTFPPNFSAEDPVLHGASLRVLTEAGDHFDNTYPLPAAGWDYVGLAGQNRGYAFKDKEHVFGPVGQVLVRSAAPTKMRAGGALNFTLASNPNPVQVVLRFGFTRRYCLAYGGTAHFTPGSAYKAVRAPAPAACASPSPAFLDDTNP